MRRNYDTATVTAREAATFDQDRLHIGLRNRRGLVTGTSRARITDLGDAVEVEVLGKHDRVGTYRVDPEREIYVVLVRR